MKDLTDMGELEDVTIDLRLLNNPPPLFYYYDMYLNKIKVFHQLTRKQYTVGDEIFLSDRWFKITSVRDTGKSLGVPCIDLTIELILPSHTSEQ